MSTVPLQLAIKTEIKEATRHLDLLQRKQIPYATSRALNDTAWDARAAVQAQLPKKLDRPTPWTIRGVRVDKSSKRRLLAGVYFSPDRAKYMRFQVFGGTRVSSRHPIVLPRAIRINKYGNIPRGKIRRLLQKPNTFISTIHGVGGVWQRPKKTGAPLVLLARFGTAAAYQPRFPFKKIVSGVARSKFPRHFHRRMAAAIRTAR